MKTFLYETEFLAKSDENVCDTNFQRVRENIYAVQQRNVL